MGNALFVCGFSSVDPQSTFYRAYRTNEVMMNKLKDVGLEQKHLYALHLIFSAMDKGGVRGSHRSVVLSSHAGRHRGH